MAQIRSKQIQVSAAGDLIIGSSSISGFSGSVLSIGAANQVLTSNGTTAAWGYLNSLRDTSGDTIVAISNVASPANTFEISAGIVSNGPILSAVGSDTNIDINLATKGTGEILAPITYQATSPNALITKSEVEAVATGLDFKNSVRAATCEANDLAGFTYNSAADDNSTATPLVWTGAGSAVFDGITLSNGDRVIIKDSPDARGNGIFTFESGVGFRRAIDADNTPTNEVSGGMFAFAEEGNVKADTGWVVSTPSGLATLGTDDIIWSQFSAAGVITPGNGLEQIGTVFNVTPDNTTVYIDSNNDVAVRSSNTANQVLLSDGTNTTPSWGGLPLNDSNAVTGVLGEANGGTGENTYSQGDLLVGDSGSGLARLSVIDGLGDQVLIYNDATDTVEWTSASNIGGNAFGVIVGDSGTATADSTSDTITITGGIGISTTVADSPDSLVITFDNSGMANTSVQLTDTVPFFDQSNSNQAEFRSFENVFEDLNVPFNISGTGIVIKTGNLPDTYEAKEIDASTVAGEEGITVTNGSGSASGDIVVGLDIAGVSSFVGSLAGTEELIISNGTNNVSVTVNKLIQDSVLSFVTISGDSGSAVAETSADTLTLTGGEGIITAATDSTDTVVFSLDVNGLVLETNIDTAADEIVFYDSSAGTHRKATFDDVFDAANIGEVATDSTTAVSTSSIFPGFFTNTPISDDQVTVFFNGLALDNSAWTRSGTTLTLIPATIGYGVEVGDVIKSRYEF